MQSRDLRATLIRAWPVLEAATSSRLVVVTAYLRKRAPWLSADDVQALRRGMPMPGRSPTCRSWMQHGSDSATRRRPDVAPADADVAAEREHMATVINDLSTATTAKVR